MFVHTHPYQPFVFSGMEKIIVGTLPPPRFSTGALREGDVNFCYGSRDGQLWPILDRIFDLNLKFETSEEAITQRKKFLLDRKIGICDIVASARRNKIDASDLGMFDVALRDVVGHLYRFPSVHTLLFTGGNSKNGPEYFFRRHLKTYGRSLNIVSNTIPRIHEFQLPERLVNDANDDLSNADKGGRMIRTVSLTAPSGAANRAVGSLQAYKLLKQQNPSFNTVEFRVMQYQKFF